MYIFKYTEYIRIHCLILVFYIFLLTFTRWVSPFSCLLDDSMFNECTISSCTDLCRVFGVRYLHVSTKQSPSQRSYVTHHYRLQISFEETCLEEHEPTDAHEISRKSWILVKLWDDPHYSKLSLLLSFELHHLELLPPWPRDLSILGSHSSPCSATTSLLKDQERPFLKADRPKWQSRKCKKHRLSF